jgi:hypothetical protein
MSTLIEQLEYIKYFLEHRDLDEGKRWDKAKKAIAGGVLAGAAAMSIPSTADAPTPRQASHAQIQRKYDKMSVGDKKRMSMHPKKSDRREPVALGGFAKKKPWPPDRSRSDTPNTARTRKYGEPWKEKLGTTGDRDRELKYLKNKLRSPLQTQDDPRKFQLKNPNKEVK